MIKSEFKRWNLGTMPLIIFLFLVSISVINPASGAMQQHNLSCSIYDNTSVYSYPLDWVSDSEISTVCSEYGYVYQSAGNKATFTIYNIGDSIFQTSNQDYSTPKSIPINKGRIVEYARCYDVGHAGDVNYAHYLMHHRLSSTSMMGTYCPIIQGGSPNFYASPLSGSSPLSVLFSTTNMTNTTQVSWNFGEGQIWTANLSSITHVYTNPGLYTVSMEYSNASGVRGTTTKLYYITVSPQGNISFAVHVIDAMTGSYIHNSTTGIQNITSKVWRNESTPGGIHRYMSTGANYEFPLSIGQGVVVAASAFGYDTQADNITIPYNNYDHALHLMPLNKVATNGSWNVVVLIKSNKYGTPINSATVQVTTGVNGQGKYETLTGKNGLATFTNVSASTTAMIRAVAQGYQDTSVVVPVFVNTTQHVTIEMVGLDDTPVTTPIPTSTKNPLTGEPTPEITDENGNPITTSEGKAQWGLDQLFNLIPTIALIVASLIIAWLFWRGFDICTNGLGTLIMKRVIEGFIRQMFK